MLEHDDPIHTVNGRKSMGDDEGGAAVHQFFDRFHDRGFGRGIERGGRLVEQQDGRVFQKSARDADALSLADAEMSAAFADRAVVTVRQAANEFIRLRPPRRFADLGVGRFGTAIGDVLADRWWKRGACPGGRSRFARGAISL